MGFSKDPMTVVETSGMLAMYAEEMEQRAFATVVSMEYITGSEDLPFLLWFLLLSSKGRDFQHRPIAQASLQQQFS